AVRRGDVVRACRGVYAHPRAPEEVVIAARFSGRPTCASALALWSIPVVDAVLGIHVLVPESRHVASTDTRPTDGVVIHRTASGETGREGHAPVSVATALAHAARCLTRRSLVAAADHALHRRIVSMAELT